MADCRPPVSSLTVGGSVKPLGDLTRPAISGFYKAPCDKAVVYELSAGACLCSRFSVFCRRGKMWDVYTV